MVALVIVGLALVALVSTSGHFTRQSSELRDRTVAQWVATNRLAEYRLDRAFPETGTSTGEVEQMGRRWIWRTLVSPAPGEDDLRRVDIAVASADAPDANIVVVTGFLGRVVGFRQPVGQ